MSTDCRGRPGGGHWGIPHIPADPPEKPNLCDKTWRFCKKPYHCQCQYKCRTQRTAAKVIRGPRQRGGDLQPVTVDSKQAGDGERRE